MSPEPEIEIAAEPHSLAERAVGHFTRMAEKNIRDKGSFTVALAGGATPREMYARLAAQPLGWEHVHVFWSDERCVPPEHPDSNFRMAYDVLLSHIGIPAGNIHRMTGEAGPVEGAARYETMLHGFFGDRLPCFDFVLLGLGSDGHTASLFPGSPAVLEDTHWVVGVTHTVPPSPLVDRITLTPLTLNAAKNIIFLVTGEEKAAAMHNVLKGPHRPDAFPAQRVTPKDGHTLWLVDSAAAKEITPIIGE